MSAAIGDSINPSKQQMSQTVKLLIDEPTVAIKGSVDQPKVLKDTNTKPLSKSSQSSEQILTANAYYIDR